MRSPDAARRRAAAVVAGACTLSLAVACAGGTTQRAVGIVSTLQPAVCIARSGADGVCAADGDVAGHDLGDCVVFEYDDAPGVPTRLRVVGPADPEDHPGDCPPGWRPPLGPGAGRG